MLPGQTCQSNILCDLLLGNVSQKLLIATFEQLVASNLLKATCCLRQLLSNFRATCWKQLVESNLLPAATSEQLSSNLLQATCWKQLVACGNFLATFGKHVACNKLLATCCPCVAGLRSRLKRRRQCPLSHYLSFQRVWLATPALNWSQQQHCCSSLWSSLASQLRLWTVQTRRRGRSKANGTSMQRLNPLTSQRSLLRRCIKL